MRRCLLFALLVCLSRAQEEEESINVQAEIDGVVYEDEKSAADALKDWGVDLVSTDSSLFTQQGSPDRFNVRGRDVIKSKRLANSAIGYVLRYGFVEDVLQKTEEEVMQTDLAIGERTLKKAVKKMQKFYGLKPTGVVDRPTKILMKKSRCGQKDLNYDKPNRAKRYTLSRKRWPVHTLKYWIDPEKYTADMPQDVVRSEFERAMQMWSDQADVSWVEVAERKDAHVKVSWEYGDHGDGYPFYGPGGTLAHAFYPTKGMLHFDDAEDYTKGTVQGTNLHYVATHELGHIMGLKHSDNSLEDAIMYALYTGYSDNLQLHSDDIAGVVAAMGPGSGTVTPIGGDGDGGDGDGDGDGDGPTPTPAAGDVPTCIVKIDAAIHWDHSNEYVYIFAGDWYYRLKPKNPDGGNFLPILDTNTEPKRIGIDGFKGLPRKMDAAVETLEDVNKFYVFKGDKYFVYDFVKAKVAESGTLADLWPTDTPAKIETGFKINQNTLGFIVEDRLYTYSKNGKKFKVGQPGTNYFDKYDDLDSLSLAFYRSWAWAFRGNYYSVARSRNGKESSNYVLRSIKPDLKLPMCTEGVDQLSKGMKKKCKKELKKMARAGGSYTPISECKDFVAEKYKSEVEFNRNHFSD